MKQIEIKVDWNDGDYETIRKKLSDDKLDYFRPLFQAISKKGKRHNWVQEEREGYLGPLIDMYPDIPEEVLNEFDEILNLCSDDCRGWIHTICSIQIIEINVVENLV